MKKFLTLILAALALTVMLASCSEDELGTPTLEVENTTLTAASQTGSYPVIVNSNSAWSAVIPADLDWCTITNASATGKGTLTVNVTENTALTNRSATIGVSAGTLTQFITLTQTGAEPFLELGSLAVNATSAQGTYPVTVSANVNWNISKDASWISATPSSGNGSREITIYVAKNLMAAERAGAVTITAGTLSKTLTVTQEGAEPTLEVVATEIIAPYVSYTDYIAVLSNTTWTATVSAGAEWCTLTNASAIGNGTVTVNVAPNALAQGRAATITVAAGTLTGSIAVNQMPLSETPPFAASAETWTFGTQVWSDLIKVLSCNKSDFINSYTEPQCRSGQDADNLRYYYNWPYITQQTSLLCPSPWRLPTQADFADLESNIDLADLATAWGLGGMADGGMVYNQTMYAYYWSSTELYSDTAYAFYYPISAWPYPGNESPMTYGFQVRCVK